MSYKQIVVPVTGTAADAGLLETAFAAARPFAGHVAALYIHPDPRLAVPYMGVPVTPEVVQDIVDAAEDLARKAAAEARANVEHAARQADMPFGNNAGSGASCSFHTCYGVPLHVLRRECRLADLVVMPNLAGDLHEAFVDLLLHAHRPVLLAPERPLSDLCIHAAVGWDGGAAAASALMAALPFLHKAAKVTLYGVAALEPPKFDAALAYLKRHGIAAEKRSIKADRISPAVSLLEAAAADGATLLVAGGYGHSRLGETLFGGNTIDLTGQRALPLLLMH